MNIITERHIYGVTFPDWRLRGEKSITKNLSKGAKGL